MATPLRRLSSSPQLAAGFPYMGQRFVGNGGVIIAIEPFRQWRILHDGIEVTQMFYCPFGDRRWSLANGRTYVRASTAGCAALRDAKP